MKSVPSAVGMASSSGRRKRLRVELAGFLLGRINPHRFLAAFNLLEEDGMALLLMS